MSKRNFSEENSENNSQLGNLKRTCIKTAICSSTDNMEVDKVNGTSINENITLGSTSQTPNSAPPSFQQVRLDYDMHPGLMRRFLNGSFY